MNKNNVYTFYNRKLGSYCACWTHSYFFRSIARKFEWNNTEETLFLVHGSPFFVVSLMGRVYYKNKLFQADKTPKRIN